MAAARRWQATGTSHKDIRELKYDGTRLWYFEPYQD